MEFVFPNNFLWGAATSSHQVEGNNINNDWWQWEEFGHTKDKSGVGANHYELFKEDFKLAKSLNHNAHRLSIEWSRIEPRQGEFNQREVEHYKQVIASLKENNLEPIVTLHHFSNPLWFSELGGWLQKNASSYFLNYVEKIVNALGSDVKYWITINEPMVFVYHSYYVGIWPPGEKSLIKAFKVKKNLIDAHINSYNLIHKIYKDNNWPASPVGGHKPFVSIAENLRLFIPCKHNFLNFVSAFLRARAYETLSYLYKAKTLDYIGINYYNSDIVAFNWRNILGENCENPKHNHTKERSAFGWPVRPEGLFSILISLKKYSLPIIITENGIYAKDDNQRLSFIVRHLEQIAKAIGRGVNVIGYIYWSLMDNFEWDSGFGPRFGIIEIDYNTLKRTPRQSAYNLAKIARDNKLVI